MMEFHIEEVRNGPYDVFTGRVDYTVEAGCYKEAVAEYIGIGLDVDVNEEWVVYVTIDARRDPPRLYRLRCDEDGSIDFSMKGESYE